MANETLVPTTPPDIGVLLQNTVDEYGKNIGQYAMAGVGHLLYSVPVVLISIVVLYIVLFIGVFGTAIASTAAIAALPQDLAGFGASSVV